MLVNFGLDTALPVHTRASGELLFDFWKIQKLCEFFLWVTGDFLPQTRLILWPSVLVGKRGANLNSLRALERVLKNLGR